MTVQVYLVPWILYLATTKSRQLHEMDKSQLTPKECTENVT